MAPDDHTTWRPTASLDVLRLRAEIIARLRAYFARENVLEVETPLLSSAGTTDPHLHSFSARSLAPGDTAPAYYLHTSPEFAMKRLLAAGSGSIYQIAKVFRAGEAGRKHNPEFTMLEWYRVGYDHHRLMDDVEAAIAAALAGTVVLQPSERVTYREAFKRHAGIDPHNASVADWVACAEAHSIAVEHLGDDVDTWRNLILTHVIERHLGRGPRLTFLYDYPASQAALARIRPGTPPLAERFEAYVEGMELANGFHELADASEQHRRFEADGARRAAEGLAHVPADARLLQALQAGLPECSGVALGVDRLIMLAARAESIESVVTFPIARA